jgi:phytoene synthase
VGLICAEIFGYRERRVLDYARDLGVALQLTNILRDVAVDFRRDRVYLPQDEFARFGCSENDIRSEVEAAGKGVQSPQVRALLEFQAKRARDYFSLAIQALPKDDARRFVAAEIMRVIYFDLLCRIEGAGFDVFTSVVRVPRPRQARLAFGVWWTRR